MIASQTVRRLVAVAPNRVALREDDGVPEPAPNDITIQVERTLISAGTELAKVAGLTGARSGNDWSRDPLPFGYSAAGTIVAVGANVARFSIGDRVSAWAPHASAAVISAERAAVLPANVSFESGAFGTLLALAFHIVHRSGAQLSHSCAVVGFGLVGQLTALVAQLAGACNVIVFEHRASRVALARELGFVVAPDARDIETVFETAGSVSAFHDALRVVAPGGRVIVAGSLREKVEVDVYREIHLKGVTLIGAHGATQIARPGGNRFSERENREMALAYLATRRLVVEPLVSHRMRAVEASDAFALLERKAGNAVVLDWTTR